MWEVVVKKRDDFVLEIESERIGPGLDARQESERKFELSGVRHMSTLVLNERRG